MIKGEIKKAERSQPTHVASLPALARMMPSPPGWFSRKSVTS
jgi:hypothetical protein